MGPARASADPASRAAQVNDLAHATGRLAEALRDLEYSLEVSRAIAADQGCQRLLEKARDRLWSVLAQREALGIRRHGLLFEVLRVPAEVRVGVGSGAGPAAVG
jgi:hypothetical protein